MRGIAFLLVLVNFINPFQDQGGDTPRIDSPQSGQICSGTVLISGYTDIPGFISVDFSFAFEDSLDWFFIDNSDIPIRNGPLFSWDTTAIGDGTYKLRVRVLLVDGQYSETIVQKITIKNVIQLTNVDLMTESDGVISTPSITPQEGKIYLTPTLLSENAASLSSAEITTAILFGSGFSMLSLMLIIIYIKIKGK